MVLPYYPTMYPIPGLGLSRPPLAMVPNATIPASTSFSLSAGGYGPGPGYPVPDYQNQSEMRPPPNMNSPTFYINNACFQQSLYPFAGMFIGNTTATPVLSENAGHHEQPTPVTFPRPLQVPMQAEAVMTEQQVEGRVAQEGLVGVEAAQECRSVHGQDCQMNVGFHESLSGPEVQGDQWGNQSGSYSEENTAEMENRINEVSVIV